MTDRIKELREKLLFKYENDGFFFDITWLVVGIFKAIKKRLRRSK